MNRLRSANIKSYGSSDSLSESSPLLSERTHADNQIPGPMGGKTHSGEFGQHSGNAGPHSGSGASDSSSEYPEGRKCLSNRVDGGWAWMVAVTAFFIIMFVDGIGFTYGILTESLIPYFHLEDNIAAVTVPGAVIQGMYLMAGPVASVLTIRFGARVVAVTGSILACVGFVTASFSPNIEVMALTYGATAGLGFSFLFFTSMVTTTSYFSRWQSVGVGLASCGSGVGIFIYPLIASNILLILNWQWCLRIQGGMLLFCVLLALTFKPVATPNRKPAQRPTICDAFKASFNVKLLKNPVFVIILLMAAVSTIGIMIPFNYIPLTAIDRNMTTEESSWLVSIMGASNTAGRVLIGVVALKAPFNPLVFLIMAHSMGAVATCLSLFCNTFTLLAVYCGFFGLVYGIDAALSTVILARTLGVENLSGAFGLLCLCRGITGMIVTPLAGALYDFTDNYDATYYLAGASLGVTALLSLLAWILAHRRRSETSFEYKKDPKIVTQSQSGSSSEYSLERLMKI